MSYKPVTLDATAPARFADSLNALPVGTTWPDRDNQWWTRTPQGWLQDGNPETGHWPNDVFAVFANPDPKLKAAT